jgi:hypothetical protein
VDHEAFGAFAGENHWAIIASSKSVGPAIEPQTGFGTLGPVTSVTTGAKDRLDVFNEIDGARDWRGQAGDIDGGLTA